MQEVTASAQIAERFGPNSVLWTFHTIQPSSLSFFRPRIFRRPWSAPHDAVCSEIDYVLRKCSYLPLKTARQKIPIFAHFRTQSRHFQVRRSPMRGKSGNLKQWGSICSYGYDVGTKNGGSHQPRPRSVVHLGHGLRHANVRIDVSSSV